MTIVYQGEQVETGAANVADFLAERGVDPEKALVEFAGEVYAPGADLKAVALADGAALDVFRIVAGG